MSAAFWIVLGAAVLGAVCAFVAHVIDCQLREDAGVDLHQDKVSPTGLRK